MDRRDFLLALGAAVFGAPPRTTTALADAHHVSGVAVLPADCHVELVFAGVRAPHSSLWLLARP